jgi:hypothetical protein
MVGEHARDDAVGSGWWFVSGFLELAHSENEQFVLCQKPTLLRTPQAGLTIAAGRVTQEMNELRKIRR